jgi:hypothetical protein
MKIEKLTEDVFKVTVSGSIATQHEVTVTDLAHHHLTSGRTTKEELLDFSFKFLLDREPNTSILSQFDITVISQYFPEYESELLQILS